MENMFSIRKILYMDNRIIELTKDDTFRVTKNTIEVQYLCNNCPIVRQFMLPFNEIYNYLDTDFVSDIMKKSKGNWFSDNIFIFISFTIKDNIILNKLPYKISKNLDEKYINDLSYINLFSYTYELGRKNVIEMYKSFLDMTKKYNIVVGKIAYTKVHRLNNLLDKVNLIDSNKFIKILERGV